MSNNYPDSIFFNGTIIPMNTPGLTFEAVAVKNTEIVNIGTTDTLKSMAGPETVLYDLKRRTLMPGFIDPHSHILIAADVYAFRVNLNSPPIGSVLNMADLKKRLKAKADLAAPGEWILGFGYDDTLLEEGRHPTAEDLDSVSCEHPIYIKHISGHLGVANSCALQIGGVDAQKASPPGGYIRRKTGSNEPDGVLEEPAAMSLVDSHAPTRSQEEWMSAIEQITQRYMAKGVTTANDGLTRPTHLAHLLALHAQKGLKMRIQVWPYINASLDSYSTTTSGTSITEDELVTMGAIKAFQDGSLQGYTGFLSNPYYKKPEQKTDLYRGWPIYDRKEFIEMYVAYHQKGWQICVHGNGDDAIQNIIDAAEEAQKRYPRSDTRHVVIHCQTVREDQLDKMKRLGMIPAFFPVHVYYWGDRHYERFLGPFRAERINPCKSAMERDMIFTCHNDTPVTPIDPLLCVWTAVNRTTHGGRVLGENQCIPVYEALKSVTTYAAYQFHEEKRKGSIEVGKLADFVVLEENPLEIDPLDIKDIQISATIVGGGIVWGSLE